MGKKNYDEKEKNLKKKLASARKIMNLIILESRNYEKLYELEILIGKTIRLDEGQGKWLTGTTLVCLHWNSRRHRCSH